MSAPPGLVLGLLDTRARIGDEEIARWLRDLTLSWSRFKYTGDVIEGKDVDAILGRAADGAHRFCLVQAYGHLLLEVWQSGAEPFPDFLHGLGAWAEGREFLAAGRPLMRDGLLLGLDERCLAVDLDRYRQVGRPRFRESADGVAGAAFVRQAARHGLATLPLPEDLLARTTDLHPSGADPVDVRQLLGDAADDPAAGAEQADASPALRTLQRLRKEASRLRDGVFIWNLESYDDVRRPPGFAPPLRALYGVAAGLKPNFILHTLGCDETTRVVFFDYSRPGLEFRRILLEEWDGEDYPRFLRHLFGRLPSSRAHYCLWNGSSPDALDWREVVRRWEQEVTAWGGETTIREHWRLYRRLPHEFVECDLVGDPAAALARVRNEDGAVWWSNAFFSVPSNLRHRAPERRHRYGAFIEGLAARAPRLLLYGASSDNIPVNGVRAAEYRDWFSASAGDELRPGRLHAVSLRF